METCFKGGPIGYFTFITDVKRVSLKPETCANTWTSISVWSLFSASFVISVTAGRRTGTPMWSRTPSPSRTGESICGELTPARNPASLSWFLWPFLLRRKTIWDFSILGVIYVAKNFMRKPYSEDMSRKPPMGRKDGQSRTWSVCAISVEENSPSCESTEDTWTTMKVVYCPARRERSILILSALLPVFFSLGR